jgi:hypothetical protein
MPPSADNSLAAEGTVLTSETSSCPRSEGAASMFSTRMARPPKQSGRNSSKMDRSKQTEVAASSPSRHSSGKASFAQLRNETAFRWVMPTPFGRPVEPEV